MNLLENLRNRTPELTAEPPRLNLEDQLLSVRLLLLNGLLCNDAVLIRSYENNSFHALGDPTEGALLIAAAQAGLTKEDLQGYLPRIAEAPFDSDRKRMSTVHQVRALPGKNFSDLSVIPGQYLILSKGSVDGLLECSSHVWVDGHAEQISALWVERVEAANNHLASKGCVCSVQLCALSRRYLIKTAYKNWKAT